MFLTTNSGNDINVKFLYVVCYMQVLAFYFLSQIVKIVVSLYHVRNLDNDSVTK